MSDYHSNFDSVSKTMLNLFCKSKEEYYWTYVNGKIPPKGPTRVMDIGSVVHDVLLDDKSPDDLIVIYPEECFTKSRSTGERTNNLNSRKAEVFRAANPGKYVMKKDDADRSLECCLQVMAHDLGDVLREPNGRFEEAIYWDCPETGIKCRCKPDFHMDMGDHILAYDLKTTECIAPNDFERVARNIRYWLQHAHYSSGLETHYGKPVSFVFWAVETQFPYRIVRYEYDAISMETGVYPHYFMTMQDLANCHATGSWIDDWAKKTNYLSVRPWEVETELTYGES